MKSTKANHVGINFNNTIFLKAQLENEITKLERQLQNLRSSGDGANFSMLESYKEMIGSRKEMLAELPHS